jgi:hypothetical protein
MDPKLRESLFTKTVSELLKDIVKAADNNSAFTTLTTNDAISVLRHHNVSWSQKYSETFVVNLIESHISKPHSFVINEVQSVFIALPIRTKDRWANWIISFGETHKSENNSKNYLVYDANAGKLLHINPLEELYRNPGILFDELV